jgi:hypothetical protein
MFMIWLLNGMTSDCREQRVSFTDGLVPQGTAKNKQNFENISILVEHLLSLLVYPSVCI